MPHRGGAGTALVRGPPRRRGGGRQVDRDHPRNWARLTLTHYESVRGTGQYERHNPRGTLEPILVTPVGEVVVGAWVIDGQRRYLLPTGTSWDMVVDWLSAKALPELVPGAIQRLRAHSVVPPELLSGAEAQVAQEIADLEARYSRERLALDARAAVHAKQGQAMRDGLLFGTDKALEAAVARVLEWAGIQVVDVDAMLGKSDSADLLCTYQGRTVLVEVKSSGGRAGEGIYAKLVTHLELWPRLVPKKPVDQGVHSSGVRAGSIAPDCDEHGAVRGVARGGRAAGACPGDGGAFRG